MTCLGRASFQGEAFGIIDALLPLDLIIASAAFLAGALNAVIGGGTFVSFPALVFIGVPPLVANATNSVALWPAALASAYGYARSSTGSRPFALPTRGVLILATSSALGGGLGAVLLLVTPEARFARLVPWLLLFATILFTFGRPLADRLGTRGAQGSLALTAVLQFSIAIYGGYFGGGMGILMLAAFSVLGLDDLRAMNGLRSVMGAVINGVAVLVFAASKAIAWGPAAVMVVSATAGGYIGARVAARAEPRKVRAVVLALAWGTTLLFFKTSLEAP